MCGTGEHLSIGERIAYYRKRRRYTQHTLAGLVGRTADWISKIETGSSRPPRSAMLNELARALRINLWELEGNSALWHDPLGEDDVPAVRDALMSPRRYSLILFGSDTNAQALDVETSRVLVEQAWDDYQRGRMGRALAALPGLLQIAQDLEDASRAVPDNRQWIVSARIHHLASTSLAKVGETDLSWLAAEHAMQAAEESEDPLVLASTARTGSHALLANGRYEDAMELADCAANWFHASGKITEPASQSLLGMLYLRSAVAAARNQDRGNAMNLLNRAESLAERLGRDANYWQTSFGPTNVLLHRLSVELDLGNISFMVKHGEIGLQHVPSERAVSHRIDYARALSIVGRSYDAFAELRTAEEQSAQLVQNSARVRETLLDLLRSSRLVANGPQFSRVHAMARRCRAIL